MAVQKRKYHDDEEPHADQYKTKGMEQVKANAARAAIEKDWCGEVGPSSKMQGGQHVDDVAADTCEFVFKFSSSL